MRRAIPVLALVVFGAACGSTSFELTFGGSTGSIESVAADLVEGELSDRLGTPLEADCPAVDDPGVGSTFICTGTTADGEVVVFDGVVDREDHIDLNSRNLLLSDQLGGWEQTAADAASREIGGPVTVDCGDEHVIFAAEPYEMSCVAEDQFGEQAAMTITITDMQAGTFDWLIG